ncbi:hypothetical protein QQY66_17730 [Streptomyces sp. DG2A-72]|uniref:hypothetical protein n=1 Tax=Streptomyces sp. DG2A-72 TaxID=3051386 RepID=UPI00265BC891|nr:hypothetical protein [Streptomyces sp. DG2A-72]MDO0933436.1 hypothetical protein [Streptomyces sp. DG2A-72]
MLMRLFTPASLCLAVAAALLPAAAHADTEAACTASDDGAFPLTTRIHGGPASYEAGGGYGTWSLDLTNTTDRACSGIHPVVVLVDERHTLKPSQPRLEFYDGPRPRPVRFEATDADELVGAFGGDHDGFPGFTVGPGGTVTVKVRLAVTSDAVPNRVTANAAVVQRHEDDGDWVGQSNDYRFGIDTDPEPTPPHTDASAPAPARPLPFADELARTGLSTPPGALAATVVFLLTTGGALFLVRRRR